MKFFSIKQLIHKQVIMHKLYQVIIHLSLKNSTMPNTMSSFFFVLWPKGTQK